MYCRYILLIRSSHTLPSYPTPHLHNQTQQQRNNTQPTISPSYTPTISPTQIFYIQHISGLCVSDSKYPKPYYIQVTFTNFNECCMVSHDKETCFANEPPEEEEEEGTTKPPVTTWPTITPGPQTPSPTISSKYYIDHFSGMCIDVTDGRSPPHYITEIYTDYWTCCAHSFMRDKCLEEGPTRIPTNGPTFIESLMPSTSPTISQSPSDFDGPTNSPTTLYWGKFFLLMCHICSNSI